MSWVLLSLRKSELKRTHADYVAQDLKISREERQASRRYQYEQTLVQNGQRSALRNLQDQYKTARKSYTDSLAQAKEDLGSIDPNDAQAIAYQNAEISRLQNEMDQLRADYESDVNDEKTVWEEDLQAIEEEANDTETMYEQEKVKVETQMEAVAQELQAVSEAISQQIQNETIKIS